MEEAESGEFSLYETSDIVFISKYPTHVGEQLFYHFDVTFQKEHYAIHTLETY